MAPAQTRAVVERRRRKLIPARIAAALRLSKSTVSRALASQVQSLL